MTKKDFLAYKIPILVKEGYSSSQAAAIAYSMYNKQPKMQEGNYITIEGTPQEDNVGYIPSYGTLQRAQQNRGINSQMFMNPETGQYQNNYDESGNAINMNLPKPQTNYQFPMFPSASLESSLYTLGQGLGEKDPFKTGVGASLSLLKIGRTGLAGYATGKRDKETYQDMYKNLYEDQRRPQMLQEGAEIKNSEVMTGQYIVDNPQGGNVELEKHEMVKDEKTGNIQKVIGDKHVDGGVDATLSDAKILSNYTQIGRENAKRFKEEYNITVNPKDTFAKVMDKFNKKIGIEKHTEELAEYIEKLGKNELVKDENTRRLNEEVLVKEIEEYKNKLETLKPIQGEAFDKIFEEQEKIPKKSDGTKILDKNGKPILQEGARIKFDDTVMTDEEQRKSIAPQKPVKRILYGVQTNEVKEGSLPEGKYTRVDYQDGTMDYLTDEGFENFKRMGNYRIYNESLSQKPITQNLTAYRQEGGVFELANKYGVSPERAQELLMMQEGGNTTVNSTTLKDFSNTPSAVNWLPYTPPNETQKDIWTGFNYETVWKPLVEQTMADPEKAKKVEGWLLANKDKYSSNIQAQLEGLTGKDRTDRIKQLATDYKPGLFHNAFLEATKTVAPEKVQQAQNRPEYKQDQIVDNQEQPRTVGIGSEYAPFILPPSAMQPIAKASVPLDRIQPIKQTVEPYLAESQRQSQTALEQLRATGLPPQIQEALQAQQLASSQLASNDAVSKVEGFNAQSQFQADQFNIGQAGKEALLDAQFNQDYQNKMMQTIANQERDIRAYYNNWNDIELKRVQDNFNRNAINMQYENKQINPDGTVTFVPPKQGFIPADNTEYNRWYESLSPQDQIKEIKRRTDEANARLKSTYQSQPS